MHVKAPENTTTAKYKEYGYDIQDGVAFIHEWETGIKDKYYIIKTIDMSNKKFMVKCIMALMLCLIGLVSCGDKVPANEIRYTTIDNSVLPIKNLFYFGEGRIVSNSYVPDKNVCILKLDKDVTEIGEEAFRGCESLTSITIPESVTEIGDSAFYGCSNLTFITLPESLTEIGEKVFL